MTVSKKPNSDERLLGRTKLFWKDGHMELPLRLIHESDAARAVEARIAAGSATAAILTARDEGIVARSGVCPERRGGRARKRLEIQCGRRTNREKRQLLCSQLIRSLKSES